MTAMVFLLDQGELTGVIPGDLVTVSGDEGHHGAVVKRLRSGEPVDLVDGNGVRARSSVTVVDRRRFTVRVEAVHTEPESEPRLMVVQALAKGDRALAAVEMLTEVGIDEIVPWQATRSIARWGAEKREKGRDRWVSTARAATKQSRRSRVPFVRDVVDGTGVADLIRASQLSVVLDESAEGRLADMELPTAGTICLIVGPEGGIAPDELISFAAAGATPMRLGNSVLRTSTAGVAAASVLLARTGRWG